MESNDCTVLQQQQQGMMLPEQQQSQRAGMASGATGQISQGNVGQSQQTKPPELQNEHGPEETEEQQKKGNADDIECVVIDHGPEGMQEGACETLLAGSAKNSGTNEETNIVRQQQKQNSQYLPKFSKKFEAVMKENSERIKLLKQTKREKQQQELFDLLQSYFKDDDSPVDTRLLEEVFHANCSDAILGPDMTDNSVHIDEQASAPVGSEINAETAVGQQDYPHRISSSFKQIEDAREQNKRRIEKLKEQLQAAQQEDL